MRVMSGIRIQAATGQTDRRSNEHTTEGKQTVDKEKQVNLS